MREGIVLAAVDTLVIEAGADVRPRNGEPVVLFGAGARLVNQGLLYGEAYTLAGLKDATILNRQDDRSSTPSGVILSSRYAVSIDGSLRLTNDGGLIEGAIGVLGTITLRNLRDGVIAPVGSGLGVAAVAASGGTIFNDTDAAIRGGTQGIVVQAYGNNGTTTQIVNRGLLQAGSNEVVRLHGNYDDTLNNSGEIKAITGKVAVDMGAGDDRVINNGTIRGTVMLGAGNDQYVGSGTVLQGAIHGGLGDDRITGGSAADRIIGAAGRDIIAGGAGNDVFVYEAVADSATLPKADRILDFTAGDRIDLTAIDADVVTAGDQAFTFIGDAAFGGTAGELRAVVRGDNLLVFADVDGDRVADLTIVLDGVTDPAVLAFNL